MSAAEIVVLGAGVSGLTSAIVLAEAGHRVTVRAAAQGSGTTSYAAGATWSLYLVEQSDRVRAWGAATLEALRALAGPQTGIALVDGVDKGVRRSAPVVDMPRYLGYLRGRAQAAGVVVETARVTSLDVAPLVINCTGAGARKLAADPELVPVRGQIVVVRNPGVTEFFISAQEPPTYWFPHGDTVVLGGTAQAGDTDPTPDPEVASAILARCALVEPRFTDVRVIGHRVGLRPTRPTVRLEQSSVGASRVIHNYGHGGAGVTLSWGCAAEVAGLV